MNEWGAGGVAVKSQQNDGNYKSASRRQSSPGAVKSQQNDGNYK